MADTLPQIFVDTVALSVIIGAKVAIEVDVWRRHPATNGAS